jgi:hypothetical protein
MKGLLFYTLFLKGYGYSTLTCMLAPDAGNVRKCTCCIFVEVLVSPAGNITVDCSILDKVCNIVVLLVMVIDSV